MSRNVNKQTPPPSRENAGIRAFTLVELLTVISIMAIMMVAVLPAFNGIKGAGDLTRVAYEVAGTLEQARAYAMANNTYVFVGFTERDGMDATQAGVGQILLAAMGSKDGTRGFGTGNSNLVPLSKLRQIENVHLVEYLQPEEGPLPNSGAMTRPDVVDECRVGNKKFQLGDPYKSGFTASSDYAFTKIIQFDPRGTASIPSATVSVPHWMEIGLVSARGSAVVSKTNCAALVLDGVTGSAKIYRP